MPKVIKHRTYCKNCNDFTIHDSEYTCETCSTEYTPYKPSEVEESKIIEQRARYKKKRSATTTGLYGAFMNGVGLQAILDLESIRYELTECDAGQAQIDEYNRKLSQMAREQKLKNEEDFNLNYKHLNRNDKCSCGSGKKYKQCCLSKFN